MKTRLFLLSMLLAVAIIYLEPIRRGEPIQWINSASQPSSYHASDFVFPGYGYPLLLLALFAGGIVPMMQPQRLLSGRQGTFILSSSRFSIIFLTLVSLVFIIWLVFTPLY